MDHYELFGIGRDASRSELRRAYRRLAARHHPDRNRDDPAAATRRMAEINDAFATLSDPVRKFDYDRRLSRAARPEASRPDEPSPRRTEQPADHPTRPPDDDPVRRARREAKERAAADARARRYRDPGGGFFEGSRYH